LVPECNRNHTPSCTKDIRNTIDNIPSTILDNNKSSEELHRKYKYWLHRKMSTWESNRKMNTLELHRKKMKYMRHENRKNIDKELVEHIQMGSICQSCCSRGYQDHRDNRNCIVDSSKGIPHKLEHKVESMDKLYR